MASLTAADVEKNRCEKVSEDEDVRARESVLPRNYHHARLDTRQHFGVRVGLDSELNVP